MKTDPDQINTEMSQKSSRRPQWVRAATATQHSPWEDAQGIFTAILLVSLAMAMIQKLGLVTGGVTGLALVASYMTGWPLGILFFLFNAPFYVLAILRMGWGFTLKTIAAVGLMSVAIELQPDWLTFESLNPIYGSMMGGILIGVGFVAMFRHRASLGGFGILAMWLQDLLGWRAGWTQLGLDACVFLIASFVMPLPTLLYSLIGAIILNVILAVNHRADRYLAR